MLKFLKSPKGIAILIVVLLAAASYSLRYTRFFLYMPISDIAHKAVSFRLKFLCEGIYQYRAATGHWPAKAADLAGTPMALQLGYWEDDIHSGRVVVLWPQNWPPNPWDNAGKILAYYTAGTISQYGKQWVCWGDLRTEYLPTEKLQAILKSPKD